MQMRDSEVVASVVAGDPAGLAAAYDRYADHLYQYCRTLLRDPAGAADAVQDAFIIAAGRLSGLDDPARLRAWLYAVARNESLRVPRGEKAASATGETPEASDDGADLSRDAGLVDLRTLLEGAADGLDPGESEVIELQLRQGLETAEVASVLGVSGSSAQAMLSRARGQLEACLAVLLVCRAGRSECDELGAILARWDGCLTVPLRRRVHRHIERCATCSARRAVELRPAMLRDLSPALALAAGAAESFQLAAGVPAALKAHTVALATGDEASAVVHRAVVLRRAGAFGRTGFPAPARGMGRTGRAGRRQPAGGMGKALRSSPRGRAAVAAAVMLTVAIATVAFALTPSGQDFTPADGRKQSASASVPASEAASPAVRLSGPAHATAAQVAVPAAPVPATATTHATIAQVPAAVSLSPSAPDSAATTPGASPAPSPIPSPRSSPPPAGALVVAPSGGMLLVRSDGTPIFLLATGGTVDWSASVLDDPGAVIGLSVSSGTLTATAGIATVTVTASQFVSCLSSSYPTITINPGGTQFYVCTGWTRPFGHGGHGHRHRRADPASPAGPASPARPAVLSWPMTPGPGDVRPVRQR